MKMNYSWKGFTAIHKTTVLLETSLIWYILIAYLKSEDIFGSNETYNPCERPAHYTPPPHTPLGLHFGSKKYGEVSIIFEDLYVFFRTEVKPNTP